MPQGSFQRKVDIQLVQTNEGPLGFRSGVSYDQIRVGFEYTMPTLECIACDEMILWDPAKRRWACPECTYEVTPDEALVIVKQHKYRLKMLEKDIGLKRGGGLRWLTYLASLLRPRSQKRLPP